jgi:hypothetical protein
MPIWLHALMQYIDNINMRVSDTVIDYVPAFVAAVIARLNFASGLTI